MFAISTLQVSADWSNDTVAGSCALVSWLVAASMNGMASVASTAAIGTGVNVASGGNAVFWSCSGSTQRNATTTFAAIVATAAASLPVLRYSKLKPSGTSSGTGTHQKRFESSALDK